MFCVVRAKWSLLEISPDVRNNVARGYQFSYSTVSIIRTTRKYNRKVGIIEKKHLLVPRRSFAKEPQSKIFSEFRPQLKSIQWHNLGLFLIPYCRNKDNVHIIYKRTQEVLFSSYNNLWHDQKRWHQHFSIWRHYIRNM